MNRLEKMNVLKKTLQKSIDENVLLDYEKLINEACMKFGNSRRTIMEYLDIIFTHLNLKVLEGVICRI